jgi:anti-sigma regulatory factor (Ser/Thr protein kinase)
VVTSRCALRNEPRGISAPFLSTWTEGTWTDVRYRRDGGFPNAEGGHKSGGWVERQEVNSNSGTFRHSALLYENREELLEGVLPFLREGAARGEALLVAMPTETLGVVREGLGTAIAGVEYTELGAAAGNPALLIPAWHEAAARGRDSPGVRCVGESLWSGRSEAEIEECERHELAVNVAFDSLSCSVLCPYDRNRLPDDVIEHVGRSHPQMQPAGGPAVESPDFAATAGADSFGGTLAAADGPMVEMDFRRAELSDLRGFLRERLDDSALGRERHEDLVLAGDELATNSIRHANGRGTMRIWEDVDRIYCEVADDGLIEDPLVGRLRPSLDEDHGRGLWLANQLCDLVQIRSGPAGTVVRLSMRTGASGAGPAADPKSSA